MFSKLCSAALLMSVCGCAGGCLIVRGSSIDETGVKVGSSTLSQIQPGQTTEAWLLAALGEPIRRSAVNEHTSILRYDHTVTTQKGGTVFLLFAGGDQKEETTSAVFEVTDGVVTKYWTES